MFANCLHQIAATAQRRGDVGEIPSLPLDSRACKVKSPVIRVCCDTVQLLRSLFCISHHHDSYYDATDIALVAILDRMCDVLSARINARRKPKARRSCPGSNGNGECDDCRKLQPELGLDHVTETTLLATKLAEELTSARRIVGWAAEVENRLSSLIGYHKAMVRSLLYDASAEDKEMTSDRKRVNVTNLRALVGMARNNFANMKRPFKVLHNGSEKFLFYSRALGLVVGPLIKDGIVLESITAEMAAGATYASARAGWLWKNKVYYQQVAQFSELRCYEGRWLHRRFPSERFWEAVVFSIVVRNRSIPLAVADEPELGSVLRILKIERQDNESQASAKETGNSIPGMILEDPSVFELLKSTMAQIVYYEDADKRNCAIAGFKYHGTSFRITASNNDAWFHAETVQGELFSEAAARRVNRKFNKVRVEYTEPTSWGIYHIVVDGKLRCIQQLKRKKIIEKERMPWAWEYYHWMVKIYRDWSSALAGYFCIREYLRKCLQGARLDENCLVTIVSGDNLAVEIMQQGRAIRGRWEQYRYIRRPETLRNLIRMETLRNLVRKAIGSQP
jgi:hypothetical protein